MNSRIGQEDRRHGRHRQCGHERGAPPRRGSGGRVRAGGWPGGSPSGRRRRRTGRRSTWPPTEADLVERFEGADAVVHLAWAFQPTHDPATTWRDQCAGQHAGLRGGGRRRGAGAGARLVGRRVLAGSEGPRGGRVVADPRLAGRRVLPGEGLSGACPGHLRARPPRGAGGADAARLPLQAGVRERATPYLRRAFPAGAVGPSRAAAVPARHRRGCGCRRCTPTTRRRRTGWRCTPTPAGAFNLAAEPPVDAELLGEVFGARPVRLPRTAARSAIAAAWNLHLLPASPHLFDAVLRLPLMDCTRARVRNSAGGRSTRRRRCWRSSCRDCSRVPGRGRNRCGGRRWADRRHSRDTRTDGAPRIPPGRRRSPGRRRPRRSGGRLSRTARPARDARGGPCPSRGAPCRPVPASSVSGTSSAVSSARVLPVPLAARCRAGAGLPPTGPRRVSACWSGMSRGTGSPFSPGPSRRWSVTAYSLLRVVPGATRVPPP